MREFVRYKDLRHQRRNPKQNIYMIVHDWIIAEYKSQGYTQNNYINKFAIEAFWYFDLNDPSGVSKVQKLFERLKASGFATNQSR